jgi:glycosyltransferase involved in cell wall biosynthesis
VENLSVPRDRRVWQEALALTTAGYEVVVVCPRGTGQDREAFERREGVEIHRYRPAPDGSSLRSYVREYGQALWETARLTHRLARQQPFDIVHACNPPDLLLLAALPLRRRGARFIFDHHDLVPELYRVKFGDGRALMSSATVVLERLAFSLADVVIATNESFRRIAITRGGKRAEDVFVVRNGPDVARMKPGRPDASLRRRRHLIGYVGTMAPQDGVDHALRSLALLATRRRDWHAIFAGDGDALPELRRLASELGIADSVEFPGFLSQEDVVRLLSSVDVCLAPEPKNPLNDASTLIKIAEYMAVARPVVCFDLAESRVTAGESAEFARPNDEASFAACIDRLLDDPSRRATMGAAGRRRVEESLSWDYSKRELLAAYAHCLSLGDERLLQPRPPASPLVHAERSSPALSEVESAP